jgi:hypothetical protein
MDFACKLTGEVSMCASADETDEGWTSWGGGWIGVAASVSLSSGSLARPPCHASTAVAMLRKLGLSRARGLSRVRWRERELAFPSVHHNRFAAGGKTHMERKVGHR